MTSFGRINPESRRVERITEITPTPKGPRKRTYIPEQKVNQAAVETETEARPEPDYRIYGPGGHLQPDNLDQLETDEEI